MSRTDFEKLLIKELSDLYDAENQLVQAFPRIIQAAFTPELQEALENHFKETKNQVKRLDKAFSTLNKRPEKTRCEAMQGLLKEMDKVLHEYGDSALRDAELISAAQRIEHYEIAGYGVAKSFATQLEFSAVADLLSDSLKEESKADKKLTSIAESGLFAAGINEKAQRE